ncbi:glycosyltransferase [Exiguobacterium sp. s192]|uniref:glycosyltransferase n=1 Tax=Exiguobacterium sp. s192 TaxID=2751206 RepID=UPI001BED0E04|nr:glycosyltransferase [Exiguobacterium sp. s192]
MKRDVYFTLNSIAPQRGGLSKAVLKRANAIVSAEPDRKVTIVTLGAQTQIDTIRGQMVKLGLIDKRVHVVGLINHLSQKISVRHPSKSELLKTWKENYSLFLDTSRSSNDSFRMFDNGVYTQYIRFDSKDRLVFIDHFSENRHRTRRDEYLENGQLFQRIHYSLTTSKPVSREFFHGDGTCYLTLWHKMNSNDWSHLFYLEKNQEQQFNDPAKFYTFAFENLLQESTSVLLFSEFRDRLANLPKKNLDSVVLDVQHPNIRKAAFGHSNHFVAPFDETATVSGVWNALFERIDEWDKVITATERQKQHMIDTFGHPSTFHAIAHGITTNSAMATTAFPEVNPNRFIVVSRIQIKKDVAESVRAMRHIVDQNPEAFLDFYGFGYNDQLEKDLHALIEELSLTNHIHFKGFVTDIRQAYEGAVATLFTSRSEGFGMAILESMSYGVPVVSYDICYGPAEIIDDSVTGFLVPKNETKKFAEAATLLMKNPHLRYYMGKKASSSVDRFSDTIFQQKWVQLLDELDRPIK